MIDPLRGSEAKPRPYTVAASAPYVAALGLGGGGALTIALPGMGDHVLAGAIPGARAPVLEVAPSPPPDLDLWGHAVALGAAAGLGHRGALAGFAFRLEKALGWGSGLGGDAAAWLAAALCAAACAGRRPDTSALVEAGARDLAERRRRTPGADDLRRWRGVLETALGGGARLRAGAQSEALPWAGAPGVIAIIPSASHRTRDAVDAPTADAGAERDAAAGDLDALRACLAPPGELEPPWRAAVEAATRAGASCVAPTADGEALLALCRDHRDAREIRAAAITAFGVAGVWSRGRCGRPGAPARSWALEPDLRAP